MPSLTSSPNLPPNLSPTSSLPPLPSLSLDCFPNPALRRDPPYGAARSAIPGEAALAAARAEITRWPGYQPTPLVALPALAARLGVAAIHYKDEGSRFGLGSFKALGGAYAVARLLAREVAAAPAARSRPPISPSPGCARCAPTSP